MPYVAFDTATSGSGSTTATGNRSSTLTFLMVMFSLTEGAPTQAAPVVTIPAR